MVFTAFAVLVSSAGVVFVAVVVFGAVVVGVVVFGTTAAFFVLGVAAFVVTGAGVVVDVSVLVAVLEPATTCGTAAGSVTVVGVDVTGTVVEVVAPATAVDGAVEV
ncbi:MAG TPA: hypothetical protein VFY38_12140, partial [Pseudonocardia sp.]|nr:hypothetical protein [Pseudonocardia sp.]